VPEITEAIKSQVDKILHTSTLYLIENQVKLAEKLIDLAPISGEKKAFFVGSGSEANEAALLFATRYRKSSEIIALRSSYHGSTFHDDGHNRARATGARRAAPPSTWPTPATRTSSAAPCAGARGAATCSAPTTCGR
jgi:4-aminobutyrate aminotransferase